MFLQHSQNLNQTFHGWCSNDCKLFQIRKPGKGSKRKSRSQVQAKIFYFSVHFCAYGECERVKSSLSTLEQWVLLCICVERERLFGSRAMERESKQEWEGSAPFQASPPSGTHTSCVGGVYGEFRVMCLCVCCSNPSKRSATALLNSSTSFPLIHSRNLVLVLITHNHAHTHTRLSAVHTLDSWSHQLHRHKENTIEIESGRESGMNIYCTFAETVSFI